MKKFILVLVLVLVLATSVFAKKEKKEMLWIGKDLFGVNQIKIDYNNNRGTWYIGDEKWDFTLGIYNITNYKLDIKFNAIVMTFLDDVEYYVIRDNDYSDINSIFSYFFKNRYSITVDTRSEKLGTVVFFGGNK